MREIRWNFRQGEPTTAVPQDTIIRYNPSGPLSFECAEIPFQTITVFDNRIFGVVGFSSSMSCEAFRAPTGLMYVGYGERGGPPQLTTYSSRFVYGPTTRVVDLPSGTSTYDLLYPFASTNSRSVTVTAQSLSVNFNARTVSGTVTAMVTGQQFPGTHIMSFTGVVDANGSGFSGTMTSPTLPSGPFSGQLYGPGAVEMGLVLSVLSADGRTLLPITLLGRRLIIAQPQAQ